MSKPPLWAVLPRPRVRARARTLYSPSSFPFTTLHHAHIDGAGMPPMPVTGRPSGSGAGRLQSSPTQSSAQPDGLSPFYVDMPAPGTSPMSQYPQPPPTPPLQQPPPPMQAGPRSLPLPPTSSSLPSAIAAIPPMSYYHQLLAQIPAGGVAPFPSKKTREAFSFDCAAYGIPKQRPRALSPAPPFVASSMTRGLDLATSASVDTDLNLAVQVGEDAYFLLPNALGVSDGVGGWAHRAKGLDTPVPSPGGPSASALFSRRLMHFCADEISALSPLPETWSSPGLANPATPVSASHPQEDAHSTDLLEPVAVLQRAYTRAVSLSHADHSLCGSSTALLAILLGDELRVAHLGDCALCLVRNGEMVFRSEEQQWKFNHPLQLGPSSSTVPSDAQSIVLKVQPDDIVILSSDGMSDNLWDEDVLDEVQKFASDVNDTSLGPAASTIRKHTMPALLSEALCSRAKRASESRPARHPVRTLEPVVDARDLDCDLPFARRAREEGIKFSGGKADDISVLVAMISSKEGADASSDVEGSRTSRAASPTAMRGPVFGWATAAPPTFAKSGAGFSSNLTFLTGWSQ
ncbi:protein serine/threonine phosphatase 2C [Exidia glandulosa HHB12029]|uniref:Protein phosphatase n=1 Tax=Exidia glandulosa HHB12029 TaxID=1314781 RepID=A0A165P0W4_EXIGL|nr:protein serine/threonine phosphatase 2C [Exidia glandulosa HHB12029]